MTSAARRWRAIADDNPGLHYLTGAGVEIGGVRFWGAPWGIPVCGDHGPSGPGYGAWPPTKGAMHPRFEGDSVSPYFYNDSEDLVRAIGAKLWIAGYTHDLLDYQVVATRVVGSPAGYPDEASDPGLFRPDRVCGDSLFRFAPNAARRQVLTN